MKYNHFLPLIIAVVTQVLLEFFVYIPKSIYVVLLIVLLFFFFIIRQFVVAGGKKEKILPFFILPFIFVTGAVAFSVIIPLKFLVQILLLLNTVFVYFYFRAIYYYLIRPELYKAYFLQNLSSYGNFLAFYFWASSLYGFNVFLKIPIWVLIIFLMLIIIAIMYQILWTYKIDIKRGYFYILLVCLVLVEIAWVASFLTLSYYVLGLLLAQCYYILIGIIRLYLRDRLNNKNLKLYLIYGFLSIFLVLLSARWI